MESPKGKQCLPAASQMSFKDSGLLDTFFLPLLRMKALKTGGHLDVGWGTWGGGSGASQ